MQIIIDGVEYKAKRKPLAIVEGKDVYEGDVLYNEDGAKCIAPNIPFGGKMSFPPNHKWSWTPPLPKTIKVELLREDAEYAANKWCSTGPTERIQQAIKEALKNG